MSSNSIPNCHISQATCIVEIREAVYPNGNTMEQFNFFPAEIIQNCYILQTVAADHGTSVLQKQNLKQRQQLLQFHSSYYINEDSLQSADTLATILLLQQKTRTRPKLNKMKITLTLVILMFSLHSCITLSIAICICCVCICICCCCETLLEICAYLHITD